MLFSPTGAPRRAPTLQDRGVYIYVYIYIVYSEEGREESGGIAVGSGGLGSGGPRTRKWHVCPDPRAKPPSKREGEKN